MHPVIVISPPRGGSSVVAKLLQEELGYMMDEGPIRKDWKNPSGYYEDLTVLRINKVALTNWKFHTEAKKIPLEWAKQFSVFIATRQFKYGDKWGFKDPSCVGLLPWIKQFLPDATWIVCKRRKDQIAGSLVEKFNYDKTFALKYVDACYSIIEKNLNGQQNVIDLSKRKKERQIIKELRVAING